MKRGSKYYGFNTGNENGVKIFREKNPENLGMKTWIRPAMMSRRNLSGDPPRRVSRGSPDILAKDSVNPAKILKRKCFFLSFKKNHLKGFLIYQSLSPFYRKPPAEGLRGVSG
jgi:hypothetical protein